MIASSSSVGSGEGPAVEVAAVIFPGIDINMMEVPGLRCPYLECGRQLFRIICVIFP